MWERQTETASERERARETEPESECERETETHMERGRRGVGGCRLSRNAEIMFYALFRRL